MSHIKLKKDLNFIKSLVQDIQKTIRLSKEQSDEVIPIIIQTKLDGLKRATELDLNEIQTMIKILEREK